MKQDLQITNKPTIQKRLLKSLLFLFTLACLYVLVIEFLFDKQKSFRAVQTEYWSHRGKNNDSLAENSIPAFEQVLKKGLTGIETDVFWNEKKQQLIISHDTPDFNKQYLLLDDIVNRFKDSASYWIDLKNLTTYNKPVIEAALLKLIDANHAGGKIYVESANAYALRQIQTTKIKKLYWVQFGRNFPVKQLKLLYLKSLIVFSRFDGFTCGYQLFNEPFRKEFEGYPLYIFHADARSVIKEQQLPSTVKVQLVDEDYLQQLKH